MATYHDDLARIAGWPDGWDYGDAKAIDKKLLAWALEWIESIASFLERGNIPFVAPHIGATNSGEVSFEWWDGDRSVTVYLEAVGEAEALLVKDRNGQRCDMNYDMIDLNVSFYPNWYVMWTWLFCDD
jgi:hypothetical protein